jgi:hypothetical protein
MEHGGGSLLLRKVVIFCFLIVYIYLEQYTDNKLKIKNKK